VAREARGLPSPSAARGQGVAVTVVDILRDHPAINPGHDHVSYTRWMVVRTPSKWWRWLFSTVSMVVEVRPRYVQGEPPGFLLWPTGRCAPNWAVSAIERSQLGLESEAHRQITDGVQ
jgi:hypothetical protein